MAKAPHGLPQCHQMSAPNVQCPASQNWQDWHRRAIWQSAPQEPKRPLRRPGPERSSAGRPLKLGKLGRRGEARYVLPCLCCDMYLAPIGQSVLGSGPAEPAPRIMVSWASIVGLITLGRQRGQPRGGCNPIWRLGTRGLLSRWPPVLLCPLLVPCRITEDCRLCYVVQPTAYSLQVVIHLPTLAKLDYTGLCLTYLLYPVEHRDPMSWTTGEQQGYRPLWHSARQSLNRQAASPFASRPQRHLSPSPSSTHGARRNSSHRSRP